MTTRHEPGSTEAKSPRWLAEAVWLTSAAHIRDVLATRWPSPDGAFVQLVTQPGAADLRTRVEVRAAHPKMPSDVALEWLAGLASHLLVAGSFPRLVEE